MENEGATELTPTAEAGTEPDLNYSPDSSALATWTSQADVRQLLVLAGPVPVVLPVGAEVRVQADPEVDLPAGVYRFTVEGGSVLMSVGAGAPPMGPASASWDAPDDDPLLNAYGWHQAMWQTANPVSEPRFDVGDHIQTIPEGEEGRIRRRRHTTGGWLYSVRVGGRTVDRREGSLQHPELDDDPAEWTLRTPGDVDRFAATLTRAKLLASLTDTVFSFRASRTIFRPYQFRPVLRLLETGQMRLLIADEVGLGKTIEAGLVWTELDARQLANRVLVVCPSMLVPKWKAEMEERFGYDLIELDRERLEDMAHRFETDAMPNRFHAVCSVERLRVWDGLEDLAEIAPRFDLVIVDEAHVFRNTGTASNALGELLSDWADALIFLSATPLNLGNADLFNLLQLLAPGEFDDPAVLEERLQPNAVLNRVGASLLDRGTTNDQRSAWLAEITAMTFGPALEARPELAELRSLLAQPTLAPADVPVARRLITKLHALSAVVTRTRKVEIQEDKAVREARRIDVSWTEEEAAFYSAFDTWQRDRARRMGLPVGFATQMPLRLASTCLPAARERVLGGWWGSTTTDHGWADDPDAIPPATQEDGGSDDGSGTTPADDEPPTPEVIAAARAIPDGVDSKLDALVTHLEPIVSAGKRVLIFTFSRPTLEHVRRRLAEQMRVGELHGGVSKDERHRTMARFRAGELDVVVASRVASEGLDFEFCSAIVNYDLPWNPMEVEQRIGRIDRIGQTEDKVLVLNFHAPGTIETDIIERVHTRIGVFTDSIGELEPILQSQLGDLERAVFDFNLSEEQRTRRIDEVLAAIEEKRMTRHEVESASAILASTDSATIDGLEEDLVAAGRYVGQRELAHLLGDWSAHEASASCAVSADGCSLTLAGSAAMAEQLGAVQAAGERSAAEIERLARALRGERDITLSLDQEHARRTGADLLTSTHPLVRAALRVPGNDQIRFAEVLVSADGADVQPGTYLTLLSLVRWTGAQPASELWTTSVSADGSRPNDAVGALLLARLAEGALAPAPHPGPAPQTDVLDRLLDAVADRHLLEEGRRRARNESLIQARRISLEETHARKLRHIRSRIATLQNEGKLRTIPLHEAQLANQDRMLRRAIADLEALRDGAMEVQHLAVARVVCDVRR